MSLIDDILAASRTRLEARKRTVPLAELQAKAADAPRGRITFRAALEAKPFSLIAEIKSKSPSAGEMDKSNVSAAMRVYDTTPSVSAISILTDEDYFGNSLEDLRRARANTAKPLLRKDFVVDEYQVWEARAAGADAVLLMAGLHEREPARAAQLFGLARKLGMDILFELGMSSVASRELTAVVPPEAMIWGINSRRFQTTRLQLRSRLGRFFRTELSIDATVHQSLRDLIPGGKVAVAESGIHDPESVRRLHSMKYNAALIGTAFLKRGVNVADVVRAFDEEVTRLAAPEGTVRSCPAVPHTPTA